MSNTERRKDAVAAALARYYDLDTSEEIEDVQMYVALAAASDGPILELACGSGRICVPLAAAGHHVTGVDRDPEMLDRARTAWARQRKAGGQGSLALVEADMTIVELKERFGLIILAFNGLLLLTEAKAQEQVLRRIAAHLAPEGRAVIDVWLPAPEDLALYDGRLTSDWVRDDPDSGTIVAKTTSAHYSPASASASIDTFFDEWRQSGSPTRTHRRDEINFLSASELLSLVERVGLQAQIVAGDHAMTEVTPDTDRLVIVARLNGRL